MKTQDDNLPVISEVRGLRPTVARITLWTADPVRLESFYSEIFGFRRAAVANIGGDERGSMIVQSWNLPPDALMQTVLMRAPRGDTELGITSIEGGIESVEGPRDGQPPRSGLCYAVFYVPDLDAVIARCQRHSVAFNRKPKRLYGPDGRCYYEMAVYDPEGTVILVVQDVGPSPAN